MIESDASIFGQQKSTIVEKELMEYGCLEVKSGNKKKKNTALLLWIICVIYVLCLSCFCVCSLPCGHLLGKG